MLDNNKAEQFKKLVYSFFRDNEINACEMSELLKTQFEFYATDHKKEGKTWLDFKERLSQSSIDDFQKMWETFVQMSIDYLREHEDVRNIISEEHEELTGEWNPNYKEGDFLMQPDLRFGFCIDGLEESIKAGKWVPTTDSAIYVKVGPRSIIEMM